MVAPSIQTIYHKSHELWYQSSLSEIVTSNFNERVLSGRGLFSCRSSFYILEINPSADIWFMNILFSSICYLFTIISYAMQKIIVWHNPTLFLLLLPVIWHSCPILVACVCVSLFLSSLFSSIGLFVCCMLLPYCFNHCSFVMICNQVVWGLQLCSFTRLLWLYWVFCSSVLMFSTY